MKTKRTELAYQEAAVRNASAIELVIMLYDILARDLHDAIAAMESGNIEGRSAKIKHGFLALQQIEGTLNMEEGGELATNMSRFYSMLRSQMLKAQVEQDGRILRELVELLFTVREAWAELNNRLAASPEVLVAQAGSSANWKA
ncbi:MAG: flagellar export chaperone FliS [Acidobacteriia bacterium]|nr:flagellar export chaperone FliS [Terriglobia bacterium]